jgi:hypothetical protein
MIRKHFKKIVILSLFFLLVSGFGIKHAVGKRPAVPAMICMTVDGDIIAGEACHNQGIRHNTTQLIVRPIDFDLSYFQVIDFKQLGDGAACFSEGTYGNGDTITLAVVKEKDGTAWARVYFWAFVNDGTTELLYGLHMYGEFDGDWPPQDGGVTNVLLNSWEMVSEGKGKLQKVSCTGSGDFDTGVTITVTRTNL